MSDQAANQVVVLGFGNLLRCGAGLGIRAMETLRVRYILPACVQLVDGGTLGLDLLCYLENVEHLLILDAALAEGPPGTLLRACNDEVPAYFGIHSSPHEIALADLLAVMRLRGTEPRDLVVLGMQPETIELGWGLSEAIITHLDILVDSATEELRRWGLVVERSPDPASGIPYPVHDNR